MNLNGSQFFSKLNHSLLFTVFFHWPTLVASNNLLIFHIIEDCLACFPKFCWIDEMPFQLIQKVFFVIVNFYKAILFSINTHSICKFVTWLFIQFFIVAIGRFICYYIFLFLVWTYGIFSTTGLRSWLLVACCLMTI